jgi:hypothetical protein
VRREGAEKGNRAGLEELKGAGALAFRASGEDLYEVFEIFVVRFFCQYLNRR